MIKRNILFFARTSALLGSQASKPGRNVVQQLCKAAMKNVCVCLSLLGRRSVTFDITRKKMCSLAGHSACFRSHVHLSGWATFMPSKRSEINRVHQRKLFRNTTAELKSPPGPFLQRGMLLEDRTVTNLITKPFAAPSLRQATPTIHFFNHKRVYSFKRNSTVQRIHLYTHIHGRTLHL